MPSASLKAARGVMSGTRARTSGASPLGRARTGARMARAVMAVNCMFAVELEVLGASCWSVWVLSVCLDVMI